MIGTIVDVIRGEGVASAFRRADERVREALHRERLGRADILNVIPAGAATRLGGVQVQLRDRLREERKLRPVALIDSMSRLREALAVTGARVVHIEGTSGLDVREVLELRAIVTLHDFSLRDRRLLDAARGLIFPSRFLRDAYGAGGVVIEPGATGGAPVPPLERVAFAGSVKPHKGGELLPQLDVDHIFGGGDVDLLRPVRGKTYGYYRAGTLPSLLARHRVGLVVVPSIVPESCGLVISEEWVAGAAVVAFDIGAQGERIREQGGGWVVPLESGVDGLNDVIARWRRGKITAQIPQRVATPRDAALAHIAFYSDAAAR